jgi:hypothetical protein
MADSIQPLHLTESPVVDEVLHLIEVFAWVDVTYECLRRQRQGGVTVRPLFAYSSDREKAATYVISRRSQVVAFEPLTILCQMSLNHPRGDVKIKGHVRGC